MPKRPLANAVEELRRDQAEQLLADAAETSIAMEGRVVWHVNATARGGGVAEMLRSLIGYQKGAGIDTRWLVVRGDHEFFEITKRIHNRLHGAAGDGRALGDAERKNYESTLALSGAALRRRVKSGDVVILHDPQTAGLLPALADSGAHLVWRCHIGMDAPNDIARETWSFLRRYVDLADELIFSRAEHIWEALPASRARVVAPAIDHRSSKNKALSPAAVESILAAAGFFAGEARVPASTESARGRAKVVRQVEMLAAVQLRPDVPIVCQVSRWDRLKDPIGVLRGFAEHLVGHQDCQLVLAGPSASSIDDDPEQTTVLAEVLDELKSQPKRVRERVVIACLPMDDIDENAVIVNALQRRANVIVQKSLAEGFGLTVAEAMWKATPVVASGVGGIRDQIEHFTSGLLVDDPADHETFASLVHLLLREPEFADAIGANGRRRVRERFLFARHLAQDIRLFEDLLCGEGFGEEFLAAT